MDVHRSDHTRIDRETERTGRDPQRSGRSCTDAVAEIIHVEDDMEIYTSGATNIFKYPELSDKQSAQEIISALRKNSSWQIWSRRRSQVKTIMEYRSISETRRL